MRAASLFRRIRFNPFTLDVGTRQLTRDNCEVHLAPKAFELLLALIVARPKVLSKAALQQHLWPETFVAEANLSNLVAEIREALSDRGPTPTWIRTAHGFGYAFCAEALTLTGPDVADLDQPTCWLQWGRRRFPLSIGEHIIGRDADAEVKLDGSTVSRRHAKLIVTAESTVLEDFGSKNGTRRGSKRVTSPIELVDGDAIYIGSLLISFHVRASQGSTETLA